MLCLGFILKVVEIFHSSLSNRDSFSNLGCKSYCICRVVGQHGEHRAEGKRLSRTNAQKDVLFIKRHWNAKVGSQETPGVTGKFGLGLHKEAGQRLTEFCQRTH